MAHGERATPSAEGAHGAISFASMQAEEELAFVVHVDLEPLRAGGWRRAQIQTMQCGLVIKVLRALGSR
jgi:hypothetical protein